MFAEPAFCDEQEPFAITEFAAAAEAFPVEWADTPLGQRAPSVPKRIAIANVSPAAPTAAVAVRLALAGSQLYLGGPDGAAVKEVAANVRRHGGRAHFVAADVGTPAGTSRWVKFIEDHCGWVDGLVWGPLPPVGRVFDESVARLEATVITRLLRDQVTATFDVVRQTVTGLMASEHPGQVVVLGPGRGRRLARSGNPCGCNLVNEFLDVAVAQLAQEFGALAEFHFIAPGWGSNDRDYAAELCNGRSSVGDTEELVSRVTELVAGETESTGK